MSYPYRVQCRLDVGRAHLPRVPMRAPSHWCTERHECSGLLCVSMQRFPSLARRARYAPHTPHTAHYTRTSPQAWTSSRAARTDMPTMCQPAPLGTLPTRGGGPNAPSSVQSSGHAGCGKRPRQTASASAQRKRETLLCPELLHLPLPKVRHEPKEVCRDPEVAEEVRDEKLLGRPRRRPGLRGTGGEAPGDQSVTAS